MFGNGRRDAGWFAGIAFSSVAAVVAALVSQHLFGMQPCPWCVLQRLIFLAIALGATVGFLRQQVARHAAIVLVLLSTGGMAAALWQHFKAAASASCSLTWADKIISGLKLDTALPRVFEPRASCADAVVALLGVPYDFWSLALFALTAVVAVRLALSH